MFIDKSFPHAQETVMDIAVALLHLFQIGFGYNFEVSLKKSMSRSGGGLRNGCSQECSWILMVALIVKAPGDQERSDTRSDTFVFISPSASA